MAVSVIEGRLSRPDVALTYGVCVKIVTRWTARYKSEGRAGMVDRSSRPVCSPKATDRAVVERILTLRRAVRTRGHFPNDDAAMKLLYLVLNHAAEEWKRAPREWGEAKTQFAVIFGERFVVQ